MQGQGISLDSSFIPAFNRAILSFPCINMVDFNCGATGKACKQVYNAARAAIAEALCLSLFQRYTNKLRNKCQHHCAHKYHKQRCFNVPLLRAMRQNMMYLSFN